MARRDAAQVLLRPIALLLLVLLLVAAPAWANEGDEPEYRERQITVRLQPGTDVAAFNARWGTNLLASLPEEHHLLEAPSVLDWEQIAVMMAEDPDVAESDLNWVVENPEAVRQMVIGAVGGGISEFEFQRMAETVGLAQAHLVSRGAGVVIAVLDTGVYESHDVYHDQLSEFGMDFVDGDDHPREEANGLDDDLDGMIDEGWGHGTMVAGLIALVAPEAEILPIRILDDEGKTDLFTMAMGIEYALEMGADVINMSFGARFESLPGLRYLFERCVEEDVIPVAGAGNESLQDPPLYPARLDEVFMVTALDTLGVKADFADFGPNVLVSAPGVGLRSTYPKIEDEVGGEDEDPFGLGAGCSFATALVSAEAALILANEPWLDHAGVKERVVSGVTEIDELPGNAAYAGMLGSGQIHLPSALGMSQTAVGEGGPVLLPLAAYPNPARTGVSFALPAGASAAGLAVFDVSGRRVRVLPTGGAATLLWDGRDEVGRALPAGTYFARTLSPRGIHTARVVLLR